MPWQYPTCEQCKRQQQEGGSACEEAGRARRECQPRGSGGTPGGAAAVATAADPTSMSCSAYAFSTLNSDCWPCRSGEEEGTKRCWRLPVHQHTHLVHTHRHPPPPTPTHAPAVDVAADHLVTVFLTHAARRAGRRAGRQAGGTEGGWVGTSKSLIENEPSCARTRDRTTHHPPHHRTTYPPDLQQRGVAAVGRVLAGQRPGDAHHGSHQHCVGAAAQVGRQVAHVVLQTKADVYAVRENKWNQSRQRRTPAGCAPLRKPSRSRE